jgi:AraC family transcriptional regulator of adaptative response / DNA-3-methyladenine glycosylase II
MLTSEICHRALGARDARFDGLFFVGIVTTGIYCRPVCPARVSIPDRRRFFDSAASAEQAGFRPCLRCRPELAPGRALIDAVPRLARVAAHRIAAGALNGRSVADLAHELGVSERHLRRAFEREIGVSPLALAQTHRLLLAKRLLADTSLSVTRIAFASGFQSLRRFNTVFREQYRMSPRTVRATVRTRTTLTDIRRPTTSPARDFIRLTLNYRAPFAWDALLDSLRRDVLPGVDVVCERRYARTVRLDGRSGVIVAQDAACALDERKAARTHLDVDVSPSLLTTLMPLLARLRQLFDLDAEPTVVDAHLARSGLAPHVAGLPGLRVPGAVDGFEVVMRSVLHRSRLAAQRIVSAIGEPIETTIPTLDRIAPSAERMADAGIATLKTLGIARPHAELLTLIARALAERKLALEPTSDVAATYEVLTGIDGVDDTLATTIITRALHWPDAFPASDGALLRAANASSAEELLERAEAWRPWRAYAAAHLRQGVDGD